MLQGANDGLRPPKRLQRLLRVAHMPKRQCLESQRARRRIVSVRERMRTMLIQVVERFDLIPTVFARKKFALPQSRIDQYVMGLDQKVAVAHSFCEPEHLQSQFLRCAKLATIVEASRESIQHGKKLSGLSDTLTQLACTPIKPIILGGPKALGCG